MAIRVFCYFFTLSHIRIPPFFSFDHYQRRQAIMRNRTLNDTRKHFLQDWANTVWRFSQDNSVFARKPIHLHQIMAVAGPRAGALEIDAGLDAGPLMKKLRADDHALHRQLIPWHFTGNPVVYMSRRYVRLEAGWPEGVAVTNIRLSEMGQNPRGNGRWIAGMNEYGATITLGFNDRVPHFLLGGYTGSGKTYAMRSAIAQLAQDAENQIVLIDGMANPRNRHANTMLIRIPGNAAHESSISCGRIWYPVLPST
jgi:hypothetical protein